MALFAVAVGSAKAVLEAAELPAAKGELRVEVGASKEAQGNAKTLVATIKEDLGNAKTLISKEFVVLFQSQRTTVRFGAENLPLFFLSPR